MGYTASICATRCLCTQPLWGRRNITEESAVAGGSSHSYEASMRRLLPWRVLTPTSPIRRSRACTKRYTSFRDYLVGGIVKRPWKSDSKRKSWTPSGSVYGLGCHQRMKGNISCLTLPKEILELSTTIPLVELTRHTTRKWGQDNEMLAFNRDAHWKALVVATLLEESIERLGCSTSRQHSRSCQCSGSQCLRSRVCWGRDFWLMSPWSDSDLEASPSSIFLPQGCGFWERFITQPCQTEALGDLCPRKGAFTRRTSRILCQKGQSLQTPPAYMAYKERSPRQHQLVNTRGGGWSFPSQRAGMPSHLWNHLYRNC